LAKERQKLNLQVPSIAYPVIWCEQYW
jgi:hypothetical protein